ncbi:sensor histidine kinase [Flammeovirga agarivorans]|uniref:histidine kinase n=1 Tax=Flammeovirga agarivorans TaxID=2726742 RepID=A0A7X8SM89_9BACT|nr:ATP-binding protein [Flammeovirga agarivorans]NLR92742.1 PAS domain-containing protein [Flammeovirga agarivorans]
MTKISSTKDVALSLNDKNLKQLILNKAIQIVLLDGIGKILEHNSQFETQPDDRYIHCYYDFSKNDSITPNVLLKRISVWNGILIHKVTHKRYAVQLSKLNDVFLWLALPISFDQSDVDIEEIQNLKAQIISLTSKEKKLQALLQAQAIEQLEHTDTSLLSDLPLGIEYSENSAKAIFANEERQRLSFEASKEGIWDWNHVTRKVFYSRPFFQMLGFATKEKEGDISILLNAIHPEDRPSALKTLQRDILIKDGFQLIFRMYNADNNIIWVLLKAAVQKDINGTVTRVIGKHSDITFFKNQSENIQKAVLKTEDKERERFAAEIHDGMGQTLTASLYLLDEFIKNSNNINQNEKERLSGIREKIREAIKEGRNIAHNIMPTSIEERGYSGSVEKIANYYKDISDKNLHFFYKYDANALSLAKQLLLLRVTQEAINNSFKHGGATDVSISMTQDIDQIILTIEDNGCGFDINEKLSKDKKGLGLQNMKDRIESISGNIFFESSEKFGTCIVIEIPTFTK